MNSYKKKLKEIIDEEMKVSNISEQIVDVFEKKYNITKFDDYHYFLMNYGNSYVKEGYCFSATINGKMEKFEIDSFYGLGKDINNIEEQIIFYEKIISNNIIPIAGMAGGDLICLEKKIGHIYVWFHDREKQLELCFDNFAEFICKFDIHDTTDDTKVKKISINSQMDLKMKEWAKKFN